MTTSVARTNYYHSFFKLFFGHLGQGFHDRPTIRPIDAFSEGLSSTTTRVKGHLGRISSYAIAHGWDGHGDGGPVPDGTYYYVITPADPRNERTTGHVTLLR